MREGAVLVCVPGVPVGKGRPRVTTFKGQARMYTPKATADYESAVRLEAQQSMAGRPPVAGPVELRLQVFMPIPQSYSKGVTMQCRLGKMVPAKKPDLDNVVKAICDAFNGVVWVDDVQVVDLHVTKRYGDNPCVIAIVTELEF